MVIASEQWRGAFCEIERAGARCGKLVYASRGAIAASESKIARTARRTRSRLAGVQSACRTEALDLLAPLLRPVPVQDLTVGPGGSESAPIAAEITTAPFAEVTERSPQQLGGGRDVGARAVIRTFLIFAPSWNPRRRAAD